MSIEQIVKVLKDKDSYKYKVEIKENAKGEAQITVSARSEVMADAIQEATSAYQSIKEGMK